MPSFDFWSDAFWPIVTSLGLLLAIKFGNPLMASWRRRRVDKRMAQDGKLVSELIALRKDDMLLVDLIKRSVHAATAGFAAYLSFNLISIIYDGPAVNRPTSPAFFDYWFFLISPIAMQALGIVAAILFLFMTNQIIRRIAMVERIVAVEKERAEAEAAKTSIFN
jgi:hypothetical protein